MVLRSIAGGELELGGPENGPRTTSWSALSTGWRSSSCSTPGRPMSVRRPDQKGQLPEHAHCRGTVLSHRESHAQVIGILRRRKGRGTSAPHRDTADGRRMRHRRARRQHRQFSRGHHRQKADCDSDGRPVAGMRAAGPVQDRRGTRDRCVRDTGTDREPPTRPASEPAAQNDNRSACLAAREDDTSTSGDLAPVGTNRIGELMHTWRYPAPLRARQLPTPANRHAGRTTNANADDWPPSVLVGSPRTAKPLPAQGRCTGDSHRRCPRGSSHDLYQPLHPSTAKNRRPVSLASRLRSDRLLGNGSPDFAHALQ